MSAQLTVPCTYCKRDVDPMDRGTWQLVVGWHRQGRAGGSDIACRQKRQRWACDICVRRMQRGMSTHQEALL